MSQCSVVAMLMFSPQGISSRDIALSNIHMIMTCKFKSTVQTPDYGLLHSNSQMFHMHFKVYMFKTNYIYPSPHHCFLRFPSFLRNMTFFPVAQAKKLNLSSSPLFISQLICNPSTDLLFTLHSKHISNMTTISLFHHTPHSLVTVISSLQSDPYKWKLVRHFLYCSSQEQNFKYSSGIQILCIRFFLCHQH